MILEITEAENAAGFQQWDKHRNRKYTSENDLLPDKVLGWEG